eukprot:scaffold122797_cov16-Prasinocladus_malaysianus.AAC.1
MLPSKRWPLKYPISLLVSITYTASVDLRSLTWPRLMTDDVLFTFAGVRLQPQAAHSAHLWPDNAKQRRCCCKLLDKLPRGSYDNSIVCAAV